MIWFLPLPVFFLPFIYEYFSCVCVFHFSCGRWLLESSLPLSVTVFHSTIWSPIQIYPLQCTCVSLSHFLSQILSSEHWIQFSLSSSIALPGSYFCSTNSAEMFFVKVCNAFCLEQIIQLQTPGYVSLVVACVVTGSIAHLWLLRYSPQLSFSSIFLHTISEFHQWCQLAFTTLSGKSFFLNSCPQLLKLLNTYVNIEDLQTLCNRWFLFNLKFVFSWMSSCISLAVQRRMCPCCT